MRRSHSVAPVAPIAPVRGAMAGVVDDLVREAIIAENDGETSLFVNGDCMAPLLAHGSEARVRAAAIYWPGDIVAFRDGCGRLRLHRLIAYRLIDGKLACLTQGDRAKTHDPPVLEERIWGRLVYPTTAIPNVGARLRTMATLTRIVGKIIFRRVTGWRRGDPVLA